MPALRSSLGGGKRTPDIEVTLSKKSNSLSNILRESRVKLSIIFCLTAGSNEWNAVACKKWKMKIILETFKLEKALYGKYNQLEL
jgi:hypothetical protein